MSYEINLWDWFCFLPNNYAKCGQVDVECMVGKHIIKFDGGYMLVYEIKTVGKWFYEVIISCGVSMAIP